MKKNNVVKEADLHCSDLNLDDVEAIFNALGKNTSLTKLTVTGVYCVVCCEPLFIHYNKGCDKPRFIADALQVNSSLTSIYLGGMCDFIIHHSIQSILTLFFIQFKGMILVMMERNSSLKH